MRYDVYGIGNALVDMVVSVDEPTLQQVLRHPTAPGGGFAKGGMALVDRAFQEHLLGQLSGCERRTISGGSGCNTMVGIAHLGGRPKYVGKVGTDVHGDLYAEDLNRAGVHFDVPPSSAPTGTCVVLVTPDAERTMFTHLGCTTDLSPADVDVETLKTAKWVYIEGYLWDAEGPRAASLKAMETARQHGVKVAYSFSDAFCVRRARDDFRAFTKAFVDLVFCNEEEAVAFSDVEDLDAAIADIQALGTQVACTRGAHGSIIAWEGERYVIPGVTVDAIDTTGAGDLYAAGILYGLCRKRELAEAGALASQMAAEVVTIHGPRLPRQKF